MDVVVVVKGAVDTSEAYLPALRCPVVGTRSPWTVRTYPRVNMYQAGVGQHRAPIADPCHMEWTPGPRPAARPTGPSSKIPKWKGRPRPTRVGCCMLCVACDSDRHDFTAPNPLELPVHPLHGSPHFSEASSGQLKHATMQKLLKRSVQAEKQVARRNAKRKKYADRAELRDQFRRRMQAFSVVNKMRVDARQKQRQDWIMGPLAPQRDTPVVNEFGTYFGAVPEMLEMGTMGKKQINLACKWAGGKDFLCLKVGDRVAIMEGPDKGQIAPINSIEEDKGHVVLGGELMQVRPP